MFLLLSHINNGPAQSIPATSNGWLNETRQFGNGGEAGGKHDFP